MIRVCLQGAKIVPDRGIELPFTLRGERVLVEALRPDLGIRREGLGGFEGRRLLAGGLALVPNRRDVGEVAAR